MAVLVTLTLDAWATRARPIAWAAAILLFCVLANNVRCLIETLPRWRNAETLWESELRRSNPTPDEFYSLASFYYTQALRTADPVAREKLYQKTESLVARAKPLYDKPYLALQNLLLLDALIAIGRNAPEEQRLVTLLRAEQVGPGNDAILWQLMLFYYKKALPLAEGAQRNELARKALGYYLRYREVSPRAAGFVVKDQAIQAEFRSDFPALGPDFGKIK
jgi:hypothetical protein